MHVMPSARYRRVMSAVLPALPSPGVITAAVSAIPGVAAARVDASGELVVDVHAHADDSRVAREVQIVLAVGLGWTASALDAADPLLLEGSPDAPLAQVIPMPRRSSVWPGPVPAVPDIDVTVPWSDAHQPVASTPPTTSDPPYRTRTSQTPSEISGLLRLTTAGQVSTSGAFTVTVSLAVRWRGQVRESGCVVEGTAAAVRDGVIAAALEACDGRDVRCVDAQLLDLAGRDVVAVVVARGDAVGMAVRWVDADSRIAWAIATLEAKANLDRLT